MTDEWLEEFERLAHAYADAKLTRYGLLSDNPALADPQKAFAALMAHVEHIGDANKMVPENANGAMEAAAEHYWKSHRFGRGPRTWAGVWAAMRAAAPQPVGEAEQQALNAALWSSVKVIAKGVPVGEVPMPEAAFGRLSLRPSGVWVTDKRGMRAFDDDQMQTYGDAREAAGYAAGVAAERERTLNQCIAHIETIDDGDSPAYRHCQEALSALRGEVKP